MTLISGISLSRAESVSTQRLRQIGRRDDRDRPPAVVISSAAGLAADSEDAVARAYGLMVAADATLYNRDELARLLSCDSSTSSSMLILEAYRRWEKDCLLHLDGDFAFAIWDEAQQRLFCARDPFGVRPFHFFVEAGAILFASSIGQLLRSGSDFALRDEAVADFLFGRVLDSSATFFAGIERLPAAHYLTYSRGEWAKRRYWQLESSATITGSDKAEQFAHLFRQAVVARATGGPGEGALLSGGLDSSSIACVARDQRREEGGEELKTFSLLFDRPAQCNEERFVQSVIDQGGFAPASLKADGYAPLAEFDRSLRDLDGPVLAPNLTCMRPLIKRVRDSGVSVLLDGHGGDEVVSHGYSRLDDLVVQRNWLALWRESAAAADNYGRTVWPLLHQILGRHDDAAAQRWARIVRPLARYWDDGSSHTGHLLSPDLVARSGLRERSHAANPGDPAGSERQKHLASLTDPLQPYGFEVLARFYSCQGIEPRYPFWDRRLVEFCVALPAEEKLDKGWSRLILRRAMAGTIPEAVRLRRDKTSFVHHLATGLVRHHHEQIVELLADRSAKLDGFVDLEKARSAYGAIAADPAGAVGASVQAVWRVIALGKWLNLRARDGEMAPSGDVSPRRETVETA